MSEKNVLGVASTVSDISDLAAKCSVRLFALSRRLKDASKPVESLSKDIAATGAVLHQLGYQLKRGEDLQVGSSTLVTSVDDLVEECSDIFDSIDKALNGDNTGSKAILGLQHYVHFNSLEPQLRLLEMNLERLKTPLALMLNVLIYAEQLKSQEESVLLQEQQELIKVLNEERKLIERKFHKLTAEKESELGGVGAPKLLRKELPSLPVSPNLEAIDEEPKAKGRLWIKEESPEREVQPQQVHPKLDQPQQQDQSEHDQPQQVHLKPNQPKPDQPKQGQPEEAQQQHDLSTASRASSATRQVFVKVRTMSATRQVAARFRGRGRLNQPASDVKDDDPSLLDMESFLRSTGPSNLRSPGEDSFNLPILSNGFRSRFDSREAINKGDSSDLLNFFRGGSPRMVKKGFSKKPPSSAPLRSATGSTTTSFSAGGESQRMSLISQSSSIQKTPPLSHASPVLQSHTPLPSPGQDYSSSLIPPQNDYPHSVPATSSSPLERYPHQDESKSSDPIDTKWPLKAVLTWLRTNSFSPEWQEAFRGLQIEGLDFVELESGQSIRKMLTVIYPQVAKECRKSGKGWDQARERAEGQRLRKLVRELPVDTKYDDGRSSTPEQAANGRPRTGSPKAAEKNASRRKPVPFPVHGTTPISTDAPSANETQHIEITARQESEVELEPSFDLRSDIDEKEVVDDQLHLHHRRIESTTSSNVPDEWVRKWTILSSEEIARGRDVARW